MTVLQWLTVLGVPSIVAAGVIAIMRMLHAERKRNQEEKAQERKRTQALESGVQAVLRALMINEYNKWTERHYAPVYAKENFENMWTQYHALGANGVMDSMRAEFMALPTTQEG